MGTHCTIHISDRYGRNLVSLYTQYDGYYEGVGQEIYDFFKDKKNYRNGFEDTALLFVAKYKGDKAYNRYLTRPSDIQEYNYYITENDGQILFSIKKEQFVKELDSYVLVNKLNYGTLKDFAEELNTEIAEENKIKLEVKEDE